MPIILRKTTIKQSIAPLAITPQTTLEETTTVLKTTIKTKTTLPSTTTTKIEPLATYQTTTYGR